MKNRKATPTRMTITMDKTYKTPDVKRLLGLSDNTHLSYRDYPFLENTGNGFTAESIVEQVYCRDGRTRVQSSWYDYDKNRTRTRIEYA